VIDYGGGWIVGVFYLVVGLTVLLANVIRP
jgi:hypothetical protein